MRLTEQEAQRLHDEVRRQQAENRAKYPDLAEVVDEIRELFPGAKVKYLGPPRPDSIKRFR